MNKKALAIDDEIEKNAKLFDTLEDLLRTHAQLDLIRADTWNDPKGSRPAQAELLRDRGENGSREIRLILLDLIFKDQIMLGDEILREIGKLASDVPVAFLTEASSANIFDLIKEQVCGWLSKQELKSGSLNNDFRKMIGTKPFAPAVIYITEIVEVQYRTDQIESDSHFLQIEDYFGRLIFRQPGLQIDKLTFGILQRFLYRRETSFSEREVQSLLGYGDLANRQRSELSKTIAKFNKTASEIGRYSGDLILGADAVGANGVRGRGATYKRLADWVGSVQLVEKLPC
jgi:hypothetical protein